MDRPFYGVVLFVLVATAYVVPLVAFLIGEGSLLLVRSSVKRWIKEENTRQQRAAETANIPANGGTAAAIAAEAGAGAGAVGGETDFKS